MFHWEKIASCAHPNQKKKNAQDSIFVVLIYKNAAAPIIANPPKVNITVPIPPVTGNVNFLFSTVK